MSLVKASGNQLPKIVIIGPTNVGKSALFNRLSRTRSAIVCDRPGVTVDRHEIKLDDTPVGPMILVDTGGVGPVAKQHAMGAEIEKAAEAAVREADLILFVVDGTKDVGMDELEVGIWLRSHMGSKEIPVYVIANKSDSKRFSTDPFYSLGFERIISVSAEHDEGILDLWDAVKEKISSETPEISVEENKIPRVIVLGRPNVGKSTLINSLTGMEKHVVTPVAGTTREPISSDLIRSGIHWSMVDTAGIRQPGRLERGVEWVAKEKLKDEARKADAAVIVVDASQGITELDTHIAGLAIDFGLSIVVAINKWDKMTGDNSEDLYNHLERTSDLKLEFLRWSPWVRISGLTGKGLGELFKTMKRVVDARHQRVQTAKLNHVFERQLKAHHHPIGPGGKTAKFYYLSQVSSNPPEFVLFSNLPGKSVHFSYKRYIVNTLRSEFGFEGTPIKLHFKTT